MAMCAMIGYMRFPAFFSTPRKRLVRSIIVGAAPGPNFRRNGTSLFDRLAPGHQARRSCLTPVPELLAMGDDMEAKQDAEFRGKPQWRPMAAAAPAARGQVVSPLAPTAFLGVDRAVDDGLVADPGRSLLVPHAAGNLLMRPA